MKRIKQIITEELNKVLNETSRRQKVTSALTGKNIHIKTMAILTSQLPTTKVRGLVMALSP